MTSDEVCDISEDKLLNIDYFLHEFDDFGDDVLLKKGSISSKSKMSIFMPKIQTKHFPQKKKPAIMLTNGKLFISYDK